MTNSSHSFLLLGFLAESEGGLQTVHQVEVPNIDDGLHGAHSHQAPGLVTLGVKAEPLQGQREGGQQDVVMDVESLLHVIVHIDLPDNIVVTHHT